jgi:cytochrome c oxidase subunit II
VIQLPFETMSVEPAGPDARAIDGFFDYMLIVAAITYVIVIAAFVVAAVRRRRDVVDRPHNEPRAERGATIAVAAGVGVTVLILLVTLALDFRAGRALAIQARAPTPLTIEIVAHQWWWEVHYEDSVPQRRITTANEIHLPVGQPVRLVMRSTDVIHSFWVPALAGKRDIVPGYRTETRIQVDRPGVYRGQCAEFCGHQHAKMGITVVAMPPADFAAWADAQRKPAALPTDSLQQVGQRVFLERSCALCHNITGTRASAVVGPDLTHLASRRTIAAGTRPNTRGHLGGWILDPHGIKPGVRMPANQLTPDELRALLAYLESLR